MKAQLSLFLAAALIVAGCDSDDVSEEVPDLLPSEAFSIDLESLSGLNKTSAAGLNFTAAVLHVLPVTLGVGVHLILPAVVTEAATQSVPEYDNGWIWSSSASVDGGTADFTLTATPGVDGLGWSMVIGFTDGDNNSADFELYTAQTALNGRSGSWQLFYDIEEEHTNVLTADFLVEDSDTKEITFEVVGGNAEHVGTTVTYASDGDERSFVLTVGGDGSVHQVVWNAATGAGSITSDNYNGGDQACWDEAQDDIACS